MRRTAAALAALAVLVLVLAGCGGGEVGDEGEAAIDLTLTLWPTGAAGDSISWRLQCEPTGGNHPEAETACVALTAAKDPFGNVPPPPRCKEIPGSNPEVAVLEGDFRGRKIRESFERANACVSGRWDRIAPVFPTGF